MKKTQILWLVISTLFFSLTAVSLIHASDLLLEFQFHISRVYVAKFSEHMSTAELDKYALDPVWQARLYGYALGNQLQYVKRGRGCCRL